MIRRTPTLLLAAALIFASCGDSDPEEATPDQPTTTIAAPLLPSFREPASARIGSVDDWLATWSLANATFIARNERFPEFLIDSEDFQPRGDVQGFPLLAMQRNQVILGALVDPDTDEVSALALIGQPGDVDFLTAFPLWVATLDPTLDPGRLLPEDLVLGDRTSVFVESNERTYRALRTGDAAGVVIGLTMVGGAQLDEEVTRATHALIRTSLLGEVFGGGGS